MLTHYNYIANVLQMYAHDPEHWSPAQQVVSFTPFVHIANFTIPLFVGPWTGMTHLIMHAYSMDTCLKLVEAQRPSAMQLTPATAVAIATSDVVEKYDLSSIRYMIVGGLPLTKELYQRFLDKGKGRWKTVQLYGMTEAAPYVSWQKVGEVVPFGAIGKLLPGIEARLVDETTGDSCERSANDGSVGPGELWIRGANVTSGYVDNPAATAEAFREGGWYNTGDKCVCDRDGYLSVVGRTKELIKYNGFQVSPADLESYILGHPAVEDVCVAATKDRKLMTELPTAYVVLKPDIKGAKVTQKEEILRQIRDWVDGKVSGYKKLRGGVWEVAELPKNATGKVLRRKVAEYKTGVSSFGEQKARM